MVAADTSLIRSQSEVIKGFNKFIEPWENVATTEESFGNQRRLLRKYEHVCIFDEEERSKTLLLVVGGGRVVNVEWVVKKVSRRSIAAHYEGSVSC